jgi:transposase
MIVPAETGRPGHHPVVLLKLYLCGYLNRIPSSRRLEREAQRNLELVWLTGHLTPDFKTIADFRRDNGPAIWGTCRQSVLPCRKLDLFSDGLVPVDGSKFKAVNTRNKNFTPTKLQRRMEQVVESIARCMAAMDTADRQEGEAMSSKSVRFGKGPRPSSTDAGAPGRGGCGQSRPGRASLVDRSGRALHGDQREG